MEKFVLSESKIKSYINFFLNPQSESYTEDVDMIDDIKKETKGKMNVSTYIIDNEDDKWVFESYNIPDTEVPTFRPESEDGDKFKTDDDTMETENVQKFISEFLDAKLQAQKERK